MSADTSNTIEIADSTNDSVGNVTPNDTNQPVPWCTRLYNACCKFVDKIPEFLEEKAEQTIQQYTLREI